MHAHNRTVDHLHVAIVRLNDGVHQSVPDPSFAPAVEAIVGRRVWTISLRHVPPRRACAQHPEDTVEDAPILLRFDAAPLRRQQRLDHAPLEVREIVAHDPGPDVWERESLFESRVQRKIEYTT